MRRAKEHAPVKTANTENDSGLGTTRDTTCHESGREVNSGTSSKRRVCHAIVITERTRDGPAVSGCGVVESDNSSGHDGWNAEQRSKQPCA